MNNLLTATLALFCYIGSPVAEMREQPKGDSEIVSQGYYSEPVKILEETEEWVKIETTVDHYQGWVQKSALCRRENSYFENSPKAFARVNRLAAHVYHVEDTIYGPILTLPFDSVVEIVNASNRRWIKISLIDGSEGYIQHGDVTLTPKTPLNCQEMVNFSLQFLGLPYTWGGRSSFGYDCSGFVQMLYRQMGVYLPRDARDQIGWKGFTATSIANLQPGDLIFFGPSEDKILHVGMSLGNDKFIHSTVAENTPYIRISSLSDPEWNGSGSWPYHTARTRLK